MEAANREKSWYKMPRLLSVNTNNTKMEYKKFLKTYKKEIDTFRKTISKLPEIKNEYGNINWKLVVPEKQKCIEKITSNIGISPRFINSMFLENMRLEASGAPREASISQMGQYLRFILSKTDENYAQISWFLLRLYFEEFDEII